MEDDDSVKGEISREALERFVDAGASIAAVARELNRSKGSVRYWLAKYGLRTRSNGGRRAREGAHCAREAGLAEVVLLCPTHGAVDHVRERRGYYRCRRCRQEAVVRRRRRVKEILVEEAGGRCRICGYSRCRAALQFHHLDPAAKEFGVAHAGMARSLERLRAEARKCILLCSNCHAEVESGFSSVFDTVLRDDLG